MPEELWTLVNFDTGRDVHVQLVDLQHCDGPRSGTHAAPRGRAGGPLSQNIIYFLLLDHVRFAAPRARELEPFQPALLLAASTGTSSVVDHWAGYLGTGP